MVKLFKKNFWLVLLFLAILFFYKPFIVGGKSPIPADTIIGLYHPYRDFYSSEYERGYPFKNFLITDAVRQTYIWKELSISLFKKGELPIWNPYEMTGKPLLANFQSGIFYPLNIVLFILPFSFSWSIFIMLQSILGGFFMWIYLRNLKLELSGVLLGSTAFTFSGFSTAWLEWGNVIQTAIWMPLILFSIDKLLIKDSDFNKKNLLYGLVLLFSLLSSFFAGHLQTFFYIFIASLIYFLFLIFPLKKESVSGISSVMVVVLLFTLFSLIQLIPTLQFIGLSARSIDQNYLSIEGFFMPYEHLIQLLIPDFFGNPTTLNYWGTWNYGELVGFIGIVPLVFSLLGVFTKNKRAYYFVFLLFASLLFALPNVISKIPFELQIPLVSSAQPTRLIFLAGFSLACLSSFGMDRFIKKKELKNSIAPVAILFSIFIALWITTFTGNLAFFKDTQNIEVAKRNLVLPTIIFFISSVLIFVMSLIKNRKIIFLCLILLISFALFDLLRFSRKFNVFSNPEFLYPKTQIINYLQNDKEVFRIASIDKRILPPNFSTFYRIASIEGYDPLYLKSYGQYMASLNRGKADISEPFGFNRILTTSNYDSPLIDFINTKYILSLDDLKSDKLELVFKEGQTRLYKNTKSLPRAFFVDSVIFSKNDQDTIEKIYSIDLKKVAVVDEKYKIILDRVKFLDGEVKITSYKENEVVISTNNNGYGFLVISDAFYPTWHAKIDGLEVEIIKTNLSFRGLLVPPGKHTIIFKVNLL